MRSMFRPRSSLDMTQGSPFGLLLRFAVPMLIGNLLQQTYNLIDGLVVGNFIGTQALAAVSIGGYPNRVLMSLFIGLGTGATIRISQYTGAGDPLGVRRVARTANGLILCVAIPVMAIGFFSAGPVLRLMNAPEDAYAEAYTFLSASYLGVLGSLGYNLNAGILRGVGDSRSPLLFLALSICINIALDLLFVPVLHLGIQGVAFATPISVFSAWFFSLAYIRKRYPELRVPLWPFPIDWRTLREVLRLGFPIGFNDAMFSLGHLMLSSIVNTHGSVFAAGYSAGGKIDFLSAAPMTSLASALTTYTGQNAGARKIDRVRHGARTALCMVLGFNALACAVMLLFGRTMLSMFTKDAEVISVGFAYILRLEPFYWIYSIMYLLNSVLNGSGEMRVPVLSNIILFWLIRLPVAYLLTAVASPENLFFCFPISWFAGLCVTGPYFLSGRWKKRHEMTGGEADAAL